MKRYTPSVGSVGGMREYEGGRWVRLEDVQNNDKLKEAVEIIEECKATICRLCKVINPHHADCEHCDEIDGYTDFLATLKAEPVEEESTGEEFCEWTDSGKKEPYRFHSECGYIHTNIPTYCSGCGKPARLSPPPVEEEQADDNIPADFWKWWTGSRHDFRGWQQLDVAVAVWKAARWHDTPEKCPECERRKELEADGVLCDACPVCGNDDFYPAEVRNELLGLKGNQNDNEEEHIR